MATDRAGADPPAPNAAGRPGLHRAGLGRHGGLPRAQGLSPRAGAVLRVAADVPTGGAHRLNCGRDRASPKKYRLKFTFETGHPHKVGASPILSPDPESECRVFPGLNFLLVL